MRNNLTVIYLLIFISVLIFLRSTGIININNDELIGYGLITLGLSSFYSAYIENRKLFIFVGSTVFLIGVLFLTIGSFEFENTGQIFLSAAIIMLSVSFLMVFISNSSFKLGLYAAIILLAGGISTLLLTSTRGIKNFFSNTIDIFNIYWPVIIILIAVITLVNKELKEKKKDSV